MSASLTKVARGGWFALLIATFIATINFIWWTGQRGRRKALALRERLFTSEVFTITRSGGTDVYHRGRWGSTAADITIDGPQMPAKMSHEGLNGGRDSGAHSDSSHDKL